MVHPGEGTEDTRRRIVIPSDTTVTSILRELVDARLVVTSLDDVEGKEIAEVAHEALIQNWRTLRGWIDADREFLRTLARIEASAAQWEREDKEPSRLLAAGRALAEGEELLECRRAELNPKLLEFITASRNAARAKDRRKFRTAGFIIAVMGALGVTAGVFAYLSTQAKLDAEESLGIAREQLMRSERQAARVAAVQRILLDGAEKGLEEWKKNLKDVRSELLIQLAENFQHMGGILGYYESAYEDWDKLLSELGMTQSVAATTEYVAKILVTEVDRIDDYFAGFLESAREKLNDQDFAVYQKSLSGLRQKLFELVERRLNSACDKRASEFGRESAEMVECAILWIEVLSSLDTSEAKERAEDLVVISRRLTEEPLLLADSLELLGLALDRVGGEDAARRAALEEAFLIRRSRRLNLNATVR